jgi:hypothetical protein
MKLNKKTNWKRKEIKVSEVNELPKMNGQDLTNKNLWDSSWLASKYPERFTKWVMDEGDLYDAELILKGEFVDNVEQVQREVLVFSKVKDEKTKRIQLELFI